MILIALATGLALVLGNGSQNHTGNNENKPLHNKWILIYIGAFCSTITIGYLTYRLLLYFCVTPSYVAHALQQHIYNSFVIDTYSANRQAEFSLTECQICLMDFVDGEELCILPHCGHFFPSACSRR